MQLKALLFDLGAVLINLDFERTAAAFVAKVPKLDRQVFLGKDAQLSLYNGYETGKLSTSELIDRFNGHHQSTLSPEFFREAWNAMILDFPKDKIEFLQELRTKNYELYLLSNINEMHAAAAEARFLELGFEFTFHSLFKKVYYSHELGLRKPDPAVFLHILKENGLRPEETLFIDDTLQHIESAQKLGIQTLHLKEPSRLSELVYAKLIK